MAIGEKSGRRVLVVDDDELVCSTLTRILALDGHASEVVSGGSKALAALELGTFDLVITDYEMPNMKGDQLAAEIRARLPTQPIVILTAYREKLKSSGRPVAADLVLGKPFDLLEFRQAINKLLKVG
ncbi:MAG TPA: response regulator [Candidatus Binatia bacterium]|jgi:CheY-like chemotaxis protein|nr:response regulator [Candidatus Binatia bacterium]